MRTLSVWTLVMVVVLGCSDSSGPEDAPLLIAARFQGTSWAVTDSADLFVDLDSDNRMIISGIRRDSRDRPLDAIYMVIRNFQGPGTYTFGTGSTDNSASLSMWFYEPLVGSGFFLAAPPDAGALTLTSIDTVAHLVYGVFSFNGLSQGGQRVAVTGGRFRVDYSWFP